MKNCAGISRKFGRRFFPSPTRLLLTRWASFDGRAVISKAITSSASLASEFRRSTSPCSESGYLLCCFRRKRGRPCSGGESAGGALWHSKVRTGKDAMDTRWTYLYRAVDSTGATVDFLLSETRDITAARSFFRKALASPVYRR